MNETFYANLVNRRTSLELSAVKAMINNPLEASADLELLISNKGLSKVVGIYLGAKQSDKRHSTSFFIERVSKLFEGDPEGEYKVNTLFSGDYSSDDFRSFVGELKAVNANYDIAKLSERLNRGVESGAGIKDICQISSAIVEVGLEVSTAQSNRSVVIGDAMDNTIGQFTQARKTQVPIGIPFHLAKLNKAIKGFYPKDLILVGARPSVGKTAFGLNVIFGAPDGCFGIISTEMSEEQLCIRFISMMTGISGTKMREPNELTDDEFERICSAAAKFKERDVHIDDTGRITIEEVERRIRYWVKVFGVTAVMVDYIQRIHVDRPIEETKRIGYITQTLKELAKELGVCILGLAQLNRDVGKENRRPSMRDLRGSGEMEQEADVIILLHSPCFGTSESNVIHPMELIIDKNRHGFVGIVLSMFDPVYMAYLNPTKEQELSHQDMVHTVN